MASNRKHFIIIRGFCLFTVLLAIHRGAWVNTSPLLTKRQTSVLCPIRNGPLSGADNCREKELAPRSRTTVLITPPDWAWWRVSALSIRRKFADSYDASWWSMWDRNLPVWDLSRCAGRCSVWLPAPACGVASCANSAACHCSAGNDQPLKCDAHTSHRIGSVNKCQQHVGLKVKC